MRTVTVKYEKLFNLGSFEHEKIGVEIHLEEGEKPIDALTRARNFVNNQFQRNKDYDDVKRINLQNIVDNQDRYPENVVKAAIEDLRNLNSTSDDLPF